VTQKFAKYLILAVSALGLAALPAAADSPCPNSSGASFDLNYYITTFGVGSGVGCTVGNLDFSNFTYNTGGTNKIAASNVGVTEVTTPDGPGLNFDPSGFVQGSNLSQDVFVGFTVSSTQPGVLIDDIYMGFGNVTTSGTGSALYTEQFCGGPSNVCSLFVEAPTTNSFNMVNLSSTALGGPVTSLNITKDLTLQTGSNGLAATSSFLNEYSEVPEPRGVTLLLGMGLLAGFVIFKRRQAVQS
jgi:hypothetical protein